MQVEIVKFINLRTKLMAAMMFFGLAPFFAASIMGLTQAKGMFESVYESKLTAIRDNKAQSLQTYLDNLGIQVKTMADSVDTREAFSRFNQAYEYYQIYTPQNAVEASIKGYWTNSFAKKYQQLNGKNYSVLSSYNQLSDKAKALQYSYISNNNKPLGSKNELVKVEDGTAYSAVHEYYHPWLDEYAQNFGFYDIFFVNNKAEVVYSVYKELDFATSLDKGPWKNSPLAKAYKSSAKEPANKVTYTDFAKYTPSYGAPAGFVSVPVFSGKERLGVLIFQVPLDGITTIMGVRAGLGENGESFLVGQDLLMRSDSLVVPETHSVINSFKNPDTGKNSSEAVTKALLGESGTLQGLDYHNVEVFAAYRPVSFGHHKWALVAEMTYEDAFAPLIELLSSMVVIGVVGMIIIILAGHFIVTSIARPILALSNQMKKVGQEFEFDKTIEVKSEDEVGTATRYFNQLLLNTGQAIEDVNQVLDKISHGDLDSRIDSELRGDLARLKNGTNTTAENIEKTINEMSSAALALENGQFAHRINVSGEGVYHEILDLMQNSFDTMRLVIEDTNTAMGAMEQGDFGGKVTAPAKGDLATLKTNVNTSLENMAMIIHKIGEVIAAQAAGDLTKELPSGTFKGQLHDLKNAINYSSVRVKEAVDVAINTSNVVSVSAHAVSQGALDLSQRVQDQASAIEETSATMEQMSSQVKSNSQNAQSAADLAQDMSSKANEGVEIMQKTINAMNTIEESSTKIAEIVTLIDGIAFQTNLLALNAAVEAARAGEHGRGFAVVAGEVRSLAQKSADAAKDIKTLVDETVERVSAGSELARNSGDALMEMNVSVGEVGSMVQQISQASKEQADGVMQVHNAITRIDNVTKQNASLVDETNEYAKSLSEQSQILKEEMSFFVTGNEHVDGIEELQQKAKTKG